MGNLRQILFLDGFVKEKKNTDFGATGVGISCDSAERSVRLHFNLNLSLEKSY